MTATESQVKTALRRVSNDPSNGAGQILWSDRGNINTLKRLNRERPDVPLDQLIRENIGFFEAL